MHQTARRLDAALGRQRVVSSDFRVPRFATANLSGRVIAGVGARGKHLFVRTDDGWSLHSHLGMHGTWQLYRPRQRWREPEHEARVVLRTAGWAAVGFRLPVCELLATSAEDRLLAYLGPDVLGTDWDPVEAVRRLQAAGDVEIGAALLDQRLLAGVGNVYRNEALFLRGIWPWTPVRDVGRPEALVDLVKRLMEANRSAARRVTTGDTRRGRELWVQQRSGEPCRRCGTTVRVGRQRTTAGAAGGGAASAGERATYWCPSCQPQPGAG